MEGDPAIGLGIERRIIQEELDELEGVAGEKPALRNGMSRSE
jgi:hypothetical protein